jgi:hypothetical protein
MNGQLFIRGFAYSEAFLPQADRNVLYVDEVNLLNDDIVDALLDAAAQGATRCDAGRFLQRIAQGLFSLGR